jgi:hypothetical protein
MGGLRTAFRDFARSDIVYHILTRLITSTTYEIGRRPESEVHTREVMPESRGQSALECDIQVS